MDVDTGLCSKWIVGAGVAGWETGAGGARAGGCGCLSR